MREYYYLVASLPLLEFGMKTPVAYEDFLSRCLEQLTPKDLAIIKRTNIFPSEDTEEAFPALREWKIFDRALRNELVKYRASKRSKDASEYIRGEDYKDPFLAIEAHWAVNEESPVEAERFLDKIRWEKIEELEKAHYFDIDYLVTYALRLQILERWQKINSEGGAQVLKDMISA
ncbi:MAG: DUF2764 domain-containing protein [Candidatus Omnitrophica bacterium]|nr:DUF2764 domain-containing protein [Candidatus Omnitrophota bacterium]